MCLMHMIGNGFHPNKIISSIDSCEVFEGLCASSQRNLHGHNNALNVDGEHIVNDHNQARAA